MCSNLGHSWQGFLSSKSHQKANFYGSGILEDQFWTGIGYIDADYKVSMTKVCHVFLWAKIQEHVQMQPSDFSIRESAKTGFVTRSLDFIRISNGNGANDF